MSKQKPTSIKNTISKYHFLIIILLMLVSCTTPEKKITPAFYHWKTNFQLSTAEKTYLQNFQIQKLYVKFFDVDWEVSAREPLPVAVVNLDTTDLQNIEIIPTIFITNRSLKNYPLEKMETLGSNILKKIFSIKQDISEIQIDCDWSESTEEKYFKLLRFFKKEIAQNNIRLTCTIRLHQVKFYKRTGVPPVDKGMLMFYNMDNVKDPNTHNSVLDLQVAQQYFYNFENYPLELDLALPIFSWGVLFRNGDMIKLINNLQAKDLVDTLYFRPLNTDNFSKNNSYFEVKKSTYLQGRYLYEDDVIRLETVPFDTLKKAATLLAPKIQNENITLSFYHLDSTTIKTYPYEKLQEILVRVQLPVAP